MYQNIHKFGPSTTTFNHAINKFGQCDAIADAGAQYLRCSHHFGLGLRDPVNASATLSFCSMATPTMSLARHLL
jgi:hypothetical protein